MSSFFSVSLYQNDDLRKSRAWGKIAHLPTDICVVTRTSFRKKTRLFTSMILSDQHVFTLRSNTYEIRIKMSVLVLMQTAFLSALSALIDLIAFAENYSHYLLELG